MSSDAKTARAVERAQRDLERHALLSSRIRKTIVRLHGWHLELRRIEKRRGL